MTEFGDLLSASLGEILYLQIGIQCMYNTGTTSTCSQIDPILFFDHISK